MKFIAQSSGIGQHRTFLIMELAWGHGSDKELAGILGGEVSRLPPVERKPDTSLLPQTTYPSPKRDSRADPMRSCWEAVVTASINSIKRG
jgi:hypothetical protein